MIFFKIFKMKNNNGKESLLIRLKYANYNVIYQTFNKYTISINKEILMAIIQTFQIISLTINNPVKSKLNNNIVKTIMERKKIL